MTDLVLCGAMTKDQEYICKCIKSIDKHKFNKKYILFDGPVAGKSNRERDNYGHYKKDIMKHYPDFEFVEYTDNINYKSMVEIFVRKNYNQLAENLLIIQDDIVLDNFDLEIVLQQKETFDECKILYFKEDKKRIKYWFNTIEEFDTLMKTHGWCERSWLSKKSDVMNIFDNLLLLGERTKFIDIYYDSMISQGGWNNLSQEQQLDFWKNWGCFAHKSIQHKHLKAKR